MKNLINETVGYLETTNDKDYGLFWEASSTEISIPETAKGIKNLVLKNQALVLAANRKVRFQVMPKLRRMEASLPPYVLEDYENYFDNEHTCLIWIKKFLKSNITSIDELPINSSCGILVQALLNSSLENIEKLTKLINASQTNHYYHHFDIIIPSSWQAPSNDTLIKKMSYTLRDNYRNRK